MHRVSLPCVLFVLLVVFVFVVPATSARSATLLQPGEVGLFVDEGATDVIVPGGAFTSNYVVARLDELGIARLRFRLGTDTGGVPTGVFPILAEGVTDLDPALDRFDLMIEEPSVDDDGLVTLMELFLISWPMPLRMMPLDTDDPAPMVTSGAPDAAARPVGWRSGNWRPDYTYTVEGVPPTLIVWQEVDLFTPSLGADAGDLVTVEWFSTVLGIQSGHPDNYNKPIAWNADDTLNPYCETTDGYSLTACMLVTWIEGRLNWDPAAAQFVDLRLGPVVADWTLTVLDQGPGFVDVRLEGDRELAFDRRVLELDLQLLGDAPTLVWATETDNSVGIGGVFGQKRPAEIRPGCESYDVIDDDVVDEADVLHVLAMLERSTTYDDDTLCRADVDRNGALDAADLLRLHRRAQGLDLDPPRGGTGTLAYLAGETLGVTVSGATAGDLLFDGGLDPAATVTVVGDADRAVARVNSDGTLRVVFVDEDLGPVSLRFAVDDGSAPQLGLRRVALFDADASRIALDTATSAGPALARGLTIGVPHPNPFNPLVVISYEATEPVWLDVAVVDARGRIVRDLGRRLLDVGNGDVTWDGRDERGQWVAAGVYHVRFASERDVEWRKVVLVK